MLIQYTFLQRDENGEAEKMVTVNVREPDTDTIISGFIDFCKSIGVDLKLDYTVHGSETAH